MKGDRYLVEELLANESLHRWVLGNASTEETHYWNSFAHVYPEHAYALEEAVEVLTRLRVPGVRVPTDEEIEMEWQATIRKVEGTRAPNKVNRLRLLPAPVLYRAAAVFAVLCLVGAALWGYSGGSWPSLFMDTYTTEYGERASLLLPDGSSVILNAHSTLKSPRKYSQNRPFKILLDGEAFFEVTKRPDEAMHPFIVQTLHGEVSVLGTAFNLNSRDGKTQVTLNEGSVQVTRMSREDIPVQKTTLTPGQCASFGGAERFIAVQEVDPLLHSSWTTSHLQFKETPLSDVVSLLKHTYGYEVEVQDTTFYEFKISGKVENDQQVVLNGLATLMDRSIIFKDGVVIIQ